MRCIRCDEKIPVERLQVIPDTQLCVGCSEAVGGDYITHTVWDSTSKEGSMKRNYGSARQVKIRRSIRPLGSDDSN